MKSNQTIHITIKEPPNPNPIRSLAVLDNTDNPHLKDMIYHFIQNVPADKKSSEFLTNVKDEILRLLGQSNIVGASKQGGLTIVYFQAEENDTTT